VTENPHALQLVTAQLPEKLGDLTRYAAGIEVLTDAIKGRREVVRAQLREVLTAAAADEGTDGASRKLAGLGRVTLTAPEPHVRVTDPEALGAWLADDLPLGAELAPQLTEAAMVRSEAALAELAELADCPPPLHATKAALREHAVAVQGLAAQAIATAQEWRLPEKADQLIEKHADTTLVAPVTEQAEGEVRPTVHPGYVTTSWGERVPGCEVTLATPQVTVAIDKPVREAEVARLREALGW
jgi:hypothetical protein